MNSVLTVVVVDLPQTPRDDLHKRKSCAWKADKLITVGALVQLVIAMALLALPMVCWVGAGVELVVGRHAGQG